MKGTRTGIDFSEHEMLITKSENASTYQLKKPNTYCDSIKYINSSGILAVTGDYNNWIFCREFHPQPGKKESDGYWKEKLKIASCQEPSRFDSERTGQEIRRLLNDKDNDYSTESKEFLHGLLKRLDDELEYTYYAYRETPSDWDLDYVPFVKTISHQFLIVLDGFEEMSRRLAEPSRVIPEVSIDETEKLNEGV